MPKYQFAATATYGTRFSSTGDWYVNGSVQRIGSRYHAAGATRSRPAHPIDLDLLRSGDGLVGVRSDDVRNVHAPAYTLVNASAGLKWDSGLEVVAYVNNIFDEDPKLSLDRERGLRARIGYNIGQPRTIGLTVRQSFGGRIAAAAAAATAARRRLRPRRLARTAGDRSRGACPCRRHRRRRRHAAPERG